MRSEGKNSAFSAKNCYSRTGLITPADLIDIAALNGLHFDGACQQGVVFHLIGALSEFGKLRVVCIGPSQERAEALYRRTTEVLERESDTT